MYAFMYSGTPLEGPPLMHQKNSLSRGWPHVRGRNQYIYVLIYTVRWFFHRGWPLVWVAFQRGFHCMCVCMYVIKMMK